MISLVKLKNNGRKIDQNRANLFKDMLDYCSRADFGFTGLTFTRAKMCRNGYFVQQRLYRIVANPVSIIKFPEVKVLHLVRTKLDHYPLLLSLRDSII